jgi:hypothetical protein
MDEPFFKKAVAYFDKRHILIVAKIKSADPSYAGTTRKRLFGNMHLTDGFI